MFKRPLCRFHSVIALLNRKYLFSKFKSLPYLKLVIDLGSSVAPYKRFICAKKFITVDIEYKRTPDIVADIHSLPFVDECADLVLLTEVLEHCYSPQSVIKEVYRILKVGGVCIMTVPFLYKIHPDPMDYFRYTEQGIKFLFRKFSKLEITSYGNRLQAIYELVYQGNFRFCLFPFNRIVALLNFKDKTSPLGYGVYAVK